jgi:pyruvate dehydrogenase (quinone)
MLLGDVLTTIQENLPIKIAVYDNGKLGFVELEPKGEGWVPIYANPIRRSNPAGTSRVRTS